MDEYVWLSRSNNSDVPIGAYILGRFGARIKVRDDDCNEYWVTQDDILRPMDPTSIVGVEDMTSLKELQEYSILRNLQIRYMQDLIYTYIGSILVAVNPYKSLPIYNKNKMVEYRKKKLRDLSPHIFAVADHNYESMQRMLEKRCIVISGESGAGKTECTKLFLQYFATISQKALGKEQQILNSNPILEAFGNAKTIYNDNSSRFGKYISINFSTNGGIHKAQIKHYLLEKSRVVSQSNGEQNYHIFYAILNGLTEEEKKILKLSSVSSYNYLNKKNTKFPSAEEGKKCNYEEINYSMKVLNFSDSEIWHVLELIAAILHFGNVEFKTVFVSNIERAYPVVEDEIQNICDILQVSNKRLIESLTKKTISAFDERVEKFLSKQEAINSRDAFVKKIYENLFNFIVEKINKVLFNDVINSKCYIGILDIFGFEAFDRNSFEQLFINYASERLQQFFIAHVFKMEQEQYATEGINWKFIEFPDNKEILDLIESGPKSLLAVINDTTKIPKGNDQCMLNKLIEFHSENPYFLKPKYKNTFVFGIQHFAGVVLYDTKDFIEKNHDACSLDMKQVIQESKNEFLKEIFASDFEIDSSDHHRRRTDTLASKFKSSLDSLMSELNDCEPFFVRCIKPNHAKKPKTFDRMFCCKQLRYSGMTEVTKIREAGYPVRYNYLEFVQRFRVLLPGNSIPHKTDCKETTIKICRIAFRKYPKPDYRLGHTKIFLKHAEESVLEAEREKILYSYAVIIQKYVRGWLARRRLLKLKKAVALAEKCWIERRKRIQEIQRYHYLITRLQAYCRGYLIRSQIKDKIQKNYTPLRKEENENESNDLKDFAKKYFRDKNNYRFSKKPLKSSLTYLKHPGENNAAKAIWITILRYTANISETQRKTIKVPIYTQLRGILLMISTINKNNDSKTSKGSEKEQKTEKLHELYEKWLETPTTQMQKLHFIVGHGIVQPNLRDEIYCQICKILTKNPSKKSAHRAWNLLSSCTGCFPPSDIFLKYLKSFIRQGPKNYISYCLFRLHRTIQNGHRTQPPFATELEAIQRQKPVTLEVFLDNEDITIVKIDSATTAKELLDVVAKNIKLTDSFGFTLIISCDMRRLPLGDGSNFVLDAVSECEQYIMELGDSHENAMWKIHLKKEMFAPWHDFTSDNISNNLIYHQIKEGLKAGEYFFDETDLPSVIAKICYAEHGKIHSPALKTQVFTSFFPEYFSTLSTSDLDTIKKLVDSEYQKMFGKHEIPVNSVRAEIVKHAAKRLTIQFSRFFSLVGSIKSIKSCQHYPEVPLLVGVNSSGVFIIDETNEKCIIAKMSYEEILEVTRTEMTEGQGYVLKITNYEGTEIWLIFQSMNDNDLYNLLVKILETLKNYSKFVMAVQNYSSPDISFLTLQRGDLINLSDKYCGKDLLRKSWAKGINTRTKKMGNFLLNCVEIIPAIDKPPESLIEDIRDTILHGKRVPLGHFTERLKHYNLEFYADKYFKRKDEVANTVSERWKYCKTNIEQPLHVKLAAKTQEAKLAVQIFDCILQYSENNFGLDMEEQIVGKIFSPAIENDELKDEIYCQLMKQLTLNPNKETELKIWELMWMITGLFPPGEILTNEVKKFLQSRRTMQIARDCLARFYKVLDSEPRKHPPHFIEIEAVKNKPCQIFHRIFFPDNTHKFFKVNSLTKFKELKEDILIRLKLDFSKKGFHLFLQIMERVFLIPDDYYLFDYLQILKKWLDKKTISRTKSEYKICLMKNTQIGSALNFDQHPNLNFIFYQEYNKYIQGHYDIDVDDLAELAGLLYKVFSHNETNQSFQKLLHKVIPSQKVNLLKMETWEKKLQENYNKHSELSEENCKVEFLKHLHSLSSLSLPYFPTISDTSALKNYIFYSFDSTLRSNT